MYHDTKSTRSQSLTVVQHTVSDLQASKRLFIHVIQWYYTVDYSGRVCPRCCRLISVDTYATCPMDALSMLELRGGLDHAIANV